MKSRHVIFLLAVVGFSPLVWAQSAPSSDAGAVWKTLWSPAMDSGKSGQAHNLEIQRDRVKITLTDGTIQFAQPANGVVFAAVFHGNGRLQADPPNGVEAHQLRLFTKQIQLDMAFTDATFSFTDGFLDEVAKQVQWAASAGAADDLYAKRQQQREDLGAAHVPRLFKGVMSGDHKRTAFFLADLKTKDKGWVEVVDDAMEQEEISAGRWSDVGVVRIFDVWMSFPANGGNPRLAYADPSARIDYVVPTYKIDAAVTGGAELSATAHVNVQPRYAGERVLLFNLDSNLRVDSVKDDKGRPLEFYQARETKDRYQSYGDYVAVVLSQPTQAATLQLIDLHYAGKRVVRRVGDGNYFCESFGWYPAMFEGRTGTGNFAFRSDFEINFRSPKRYGLVATGHKVSETADGDSLITSWKGDAPLAVAGFAFGDYKFYSEKVGDIDIQVYANKQPDDLLQSIQRAFDNPIEDLAAGPGGSRAGGAALGNLTPSALAKTIGIETANTIKVFQNYYGPYPYKQLAVTNIIGSYGQGWPGLLYLSWITFLDSTQRNTLGIRSHTELTDFFRAHESSHQWWGHRVGWKSYHDQWLSEGFAEFSGNLYVQYRQNMKESLVQWRKEKEHLRLGDIKGHAVDSLGPIWLGQRIASSETSGGSYQNLIYSKGGYVLHMIRMMLYDLRNADPDHLFKDLMQDYCKTFENKPASTEDFKGIVEKHMTRGMDLDSNHKMDWFFNQYVYGIGIPQYQFSYTTQGAGDGKVKLSGRLVRIGVPENWKDAIPLYAHQGQGIMKVGLINAVQPETTFEVMVPAGLDRFSINDYEDLLADVKQ